MKLGGHISPDAGLGMVPATSRALDFQIAQSRVGPSTGWEPYELTDQAVAEFKKLMFGIDLYVHLPYVINPCETDARKRGFYKATYKRFHHASAVLGARAMVMHPGFRKQETEAVARKQLQRFLDETYEDLGVELLLETDSGSKNDSAVGSLEFINSVVKDLGARLIAVCLDTEHLYARGVDLWDEEVRKRTLDHCDKVRLVHLNVPDPEVELGSHLDRHNSPFSSFARSSEGLVVDFMRFPCILERRSLGIQEEDAKFIRALLGLDSLARNLHVDTAEEDSLKGGDNGPGPAEEESEGV